MCGCRWAGWCCVAGVAAQAAPLTRRDGDAGCCSLARLELGIQLGDDPRALHSLACLERVADLNTRLMLFRQQRAKRTCHAPSPGRSRDVVSVVVLAASIGAGGEYMAASRARPAMRRRLD